jgi:hypothetical protein
MAPWRAELCPDPDATASRGVMHQGFPVSPVRDWIRRISLRTFMTNSSVRAIDGYLDRQDS